MEKVIDEIRQEVKQTANLIKASDEKNENRFQASEQSAKSLDEKIEKMAGDFKALEQKFDRMADTESDSVEKSKSMGEKFIDALKSAGDPRTSDKWEVSILVKDDPAPIPVWDTTTGAGLGVPAYREVFQPLPRRETLLSAIPQSIIRSGSIEIPREVAVTGNAAVVAEKAMKPYIGIETEIVTLPMITIAALAKATNQMLEDGNEQAVQNHINLVLGHKCDLALENQIINGDGSNGQFSGLLANSTAYVRPAGEGITALDDLLAAYVQLEMSGYAADAILLHPMDYWKLATAKNDVGSYTLSDPRGDLVRRVWNTRMITSVGMPQGTFIVADLVAGTHLYRRGDWRLAAGYVDDDFARNMVTLRKEGRANLAVFNTLAVIKGTFATPQNGGGN